MDINLDDNKIVKVVYKLNDNETIEFNYSEGELVSVTKEGETKPKGLTDREMMNTIKDSSFFEKLKKAQDKYNVAKEIADAVKDEPYTPCSHIQNMDNFFEKKFSKGYENKGKEFSDESLDIAKRVMKKDEDGILDLIARKHRDEIKKRLNESYPNDANEIRFDIMSCNQNIKKVKDDIIHDLKTISKDDLSITLWSKIEIYQEYLRKLEELEKEDNKEWANDKELNILAKLTNDETQPNSIIQ